MLIIGITGTLGAGKGTIMDFLVSKFGFSHFSVRAFLSEEITKRGDTVNRDTLTSVANELRAAHSPAFIIDELFKKAQKSGENCIIESIRTPGEVISLKGKGNFYLFAADADPEVRYERIKIRNSETDDIDFDTFLDNELREMTSTDPNKQNLKKCIQMADYTFYNNGSRSDLHNEIKKVLNQIIKFNG